MADSNSTKEHLIRFRAYLGERGLHVTNSILWDNEYELALYGGKWYVKVEVPVRSRASDRLTYNYYLMDVNHVVIYTVRHGINGGIETEEAATDEWLSWVVHGLVYGLKGDLRHQLRDRFRMSGNTPYGVLADRCEDEGLTAEAEVLRLPCSDTALRRWLRDRRSG